MTQIQKGVYSSSDLEAMLGNKMAIARLCESGVLSKISRGFYSTPDIGYNPAMYLVIQKYFSEGIISGHSCLFHYGYSDYQDDFIHLDYPKDDGFKKNGEFIAFHRVSQARLNEVVKTTIQTATVKIYSPERALFEAVKLEKGFGNLSAAACKKYLKMGKVDIKKIAEISEEFGENGKRLLQFISNLRDDKY